MKILFVCKKIPIHGISPIMKSQADSIRDIDTVLDFFLVEGSGFKSYLKAILRLKTFLKNNKYDIIHAHYSFSGFISLLSKTNEKLVISFMGSDINLLNTKPVFKLINNIIINFSDHIIVKSQEMSDKISSKNISIIPNGVDLDVFQSFPKIKTREELSLDVDKRYVLFVSDPPDKKVKNFQLLKKSVALLPNKEIEILTISGVSQNQLAKYYSAADLLVLTSLNEGSPNVIKEALACNCPIVATDVGDVKFNLENVTDCYICNFDENEIADKIKAILSKEIKDNSTNGREKLKKLGLDKQSVAKKIKEIYTKLLKDEVAS